MEDNTIIIMGDKTFPASKYQTDVFDFLEHGNGNLVINASAGAAKTTTLINCMRFIPKGKKVLFVSFNKHIAEEINQKISNPNAMARTCSSVGYEICRENGIAIGENVVNNEKYDDYIRNNIESLTAYGEIKSLSYAKGTYIRNIRQLVDLCRYTLSFKEREIKALADKYGIATVRDEISVCRKILIWGKDNTEIIDQTDMVWLPSVLNLNTKRLIKDYIFIDEAQDISLAQQELIMKCANRGARIIAVGDKNQQINVWCGSDEQAIEKFINMPGTKTLPLPICYRCGKNIIDFANKFSSDKMIAPEWAIDGSIIKDVPIGDIRSGDMVLSRNTAPLIELQQKMLRINKKVFIQGYKEIQNDMLDLIESADANTIDAPCLTQNGLFPMLYRRLLNEIEKLMTVFKMDEDEALSNSAVLFLYDNIKAIKVLSEGTTNVDELKEKISIIFSGEKEDAILLSTVHRAKGLEADRVFIYQPSILENNRLATKDWEKVTEKNLRYVAYTRPKKVLGFIKEEWGDKRKNPYSGTSIKEEVNAIRNILNFKPFDFDKISTTPAAIINQPKVSNISTSEAKPNCKKGGLKFVNLMKKD